MNQTRLNSENSGILWEMREIHLHMLQNALSFASS